MLSNRSSEILLSKTSTPLAKPSFPTLLHHARMPEYLGAGPCITLVLHTWGLDLSFHTYTASSATEDLTGKTGEIPNAKTTDSMKLEPLKPKVNIPFQIRMLEKYGRDVFKCPCCPNGSREFIFHTQDKFKPIKAIPPPESNRRNRGKQWADS